MLLLLLLFIVPSAVGVYFLLKPPLLMNKESDSKTVTSNAAPFKSLEDIPSVAATGTTLMRKQTVNE
ncbi:hypothetical protein [Cohnella sp.]|uniref:hypothetical protein n=1 Tax=Cohnella sp. TaxID=1883426 RepID=UPI0035672156